MAKNKNGKELRLRHAPVQALRKSGDPPILHAHAAAYTFATRCIEYGIRPKVLQQILGHASLKTTMDRYVHNTEDAMADAVTIFEEGCRENGVNFLKMA